jgi:putative Holliday junction resolvase
MAVVEIEEVLEILQPGQTVAGLDLGMHRCF